MITAPERRTFVISGPPLSGKRWAINNLARDLRHSRGDGVVLLDSTAVGFAQPATDAAELLQCVRDGKCDTTAWDSLKAAPPIVVIPDLAAVERAAPFANAPRILNQLLSHNLPVTAIVGVPNSARVLPTIARDVVDVAVDDWDDADRADYWRQCGLDVETVATDWRLSLLPADATRPGIVAALTALYRANHSFGAALGATRAALVRSLIDVSLEHAPTFSFEFLQAAALLTTFGTGRSTISDISAFAGRFGGSAEDYLSSARWLAERQLIVVSDDVVSIAESYWVNTLAASCIRRITPDAPPVMHATSGLLADWLGLSNAHISADLRRLQLELVKAGRVEALVEIVVANFDALQPYARARVWRRLGRALTHGSQTRAAVAAALNQLPAEVREEALHMQLLSPLHSPDSRLREVVEEALWSRSLSATRMKQICRANNRGKLRLTLALSSSQVVFRNPIAEDRMSNAAAVELLTGRSRPASQKVSAISTMVGSRNSASEKLLRQAVVHPANDVRVRAAALMGIACWRDRRFVPLFIDSLGNPAAVIRLAGLLGLQLIQPSWEADKIARVLQTDEDPSVREMAARVLGRLRIGAQALVARWQSDPEPVVKAACISALTRMGDTGSLRQMLLSLPALTEVERVELALSVGRLGLSEGENLLVGWLRDQTRSDKLRGASAQALRFRGSSPRAVEALLDVLQGNNEAADVRSACLSALKRDSTLNIALIRRVMSSSPVASRLRSNCARWLAVHESTPSLAIIDAGLSDVMLDVVSASVRALCASYPDLAEQRLAQQLGRRASQIQGPVLLRALASIAPTRAAEWIVGELPYIENRQTEQLLRVGIRSVSACSGDVGRRLEGHLLELYSKSANKAQLSRLLASIVRLSWDTSRTLISDPELPPAARKRIVIQAVATTEEWFALVDSLTEDREAPPAIAMAALGRLLRGIGEGAPEESISLAEAIATLRTPTDRVLQSQAIEALRRSRRLDATWIAVLVGPLSAGGAADAGVLHSATGALIDIYRTAPERAVPAIKRLLERLAETPNGSEFRRSLVHAARDCSLREVEGLMLAIERCAREVVQPDARRIAHDLSTPLRRRADAWRRSGYRVERLLRGNSASSDSRRVSCWVFMTASQDEFSAAGDAMLASDWSMQATRNLSGFRATEYRRGDGHVLLVVAGENGKISTRRLLRALQRSEGELPSAPEFVVMIGCCRGRRGMAEVGDVVVPLRLWRLNKTRVGSDMTAHRPRCVRADAEAVRLARTGCVDGVTIRSKDMVTADAKSNEPDDVAFAQIDAAALDMESYFAVRLGTRIGWRVWIAKGVSDYGDRSSLDGKREQPQAVRNATRVALMGCSDVAAAAARTSVGAAGPLPRPSRL